VLILTNGAMPSWLLEPTSIGLGVDAGNVCQYADCSGDPEAPGRLDEVTFLLERCYQADTWPWRAASTFTGDIGVTETQNARLEL
jgi:hypothetical protein